MEGLLAAFSPDADVLAVTSGDGRVKVNAASISWAMCRCLIRSPANAGSCGDLPPAPQLVARLQHLTCPSSSVQTWDVSSGRLSASLAAGDATITEAAAGTPGGLGLHLSALAWGQGPAAKAAKVRLGPVGGGHWSAAPLALHPMADARADRLCGYVCVKWDGNGAPLIGHQLLFFSCRRRRRGHHRL